MSYQIIEQQPVNRNASTFGFSPNGAALLSYVWVPVTSIIVLCTEKQNRLVRFHAFQSLFMGLIFLAVALIFSVISSVLMLVGGLVSPYLGIFVSVISILFWLAFAAVGIGFWILCAVKAYRGEMYKLPLVGKFAERRAQKN